MDVESVARVAHEAVRAYQRQLGENPAPPWDESPSWLRTSVREGVDLARAGASPAEVHAVWAASRLLDGCRHGPVRSVEQRTDPWLVGYEELSASQRAASALLTAVVTTLGTIPTGEA